MIAARRTLVGLSVLLLLGVFLVAQTTTVPSVVKFTGTLPGKTGTVGFTFALYASSTGGTPLWLETQAVTLDGAGNYTAFLGATQKDGLQPELFSTGEPRWLGVQPEGEDEQPRVLLVSVPYALKAGDAETLGGFPASAFLKSDVTSTLASGGTSSYANTRTVAAAVSSLASAGTLNYLAKFVNGTDVGNSIIYDSGTGRIGINTSSPEDRLHINGNLLLKGSTTHSIKIAGTASTGRLGQDANGFFFSVDTLGKSMRILTGPTGGSLTDNRFVVAGNGNVGVGTNAPSNKLTVLGTIESTTGGFKFPDGTTQTTASVGTITGVTAGSGLTGGGTSGVVPLSADLNTLQARVTGTCSSGTAMGSVASDGSVSCNVISGGGGSLTLPFSGTGVDSPPSVQGVFKVTDTATGPANTQQGPPDPNSVPGAVVGVATGTGITAGVIGKATGADGVAIVGLSTAAASDDVPVIVSWSQATSGKATLFNGIASSPNAKGLDLNFAVTPSSVLNASVGNTTQIIQIDGAGNIYNNGQINSSGDIHTNGNISANGSISAPTKNFKIDDPLDPAKKWLYHTSIESPDMKNMYDGLVVLDARGEAWITMPDWFEALNQDFRYQLTAIGAPGPKLYIAHEISGNRFKIAGGKKGMKVSWQVTGIRHDAWATDHRTLVEQDKVGAEIGSYYHPKIVTPANAPDATAKAIPIH